ncbi:unnamed protein product [Cladocopium goreaui]|uniref:Uncharacterized protein n=1 Tax=Cladocopium goreaui TaxID=2562237 RepID=A0A9P1C9D5_9DINO|nr:unnamed protein product [Cladocopium goreaui]
MKDFGYQRLTPDNRNDITGSARLCQTIPGLAWNPGAFGAKDEHVWQDWKLYRFPNCSEEVAHKHPAHGVGQRLLRVSGVCSLLPSSFRTSLMDPYASLLGFTYCFRSSCNGMVMQRPSFTAHPDSDMPQVGTATILPRLDQSDPEEKSEVSLSIQAGPLGQDDMTGDVFLCSLGATKCVAHMRPPAATWMLVDLLAHAAWWASRLSRSCGVGLEQFDSVTTGVSFKVHG